MYTFDQNFLCKKRNPYSFEVLRNFDLISCLFKGKCVALDTFKELSKKNVDFISQLIQEETEADSLENEADGDVETGHKSRLYVRQESKGPKSAALSRSSLRIFGSTASILSAVTSAEKATVSHVFIEKSLPKSTFKNKVTRC